MQIGELREALLEGLFIPAHPLALTASRALDERRQRALSRYYLDAGAGGLAVGVHTTQFAIHRPEVGLYEPVLTLAQEEVEHRTGGDSSKALLVAGIVGNMDHATEEARTARELGYHCGLLSLSGFGDQEDRFLVDHCRQVSHEIPLFGFYLQPAVGGRRLSYRFWREFLEIENVVAIKIAPFNRYRTLDVVRALGESGRSDEVALYTGNDDAIVSDLISSYPLDKTRTTLHFAGGLLGDWAYWARTKVELFLRCREERRSGVSPELLALGAQITDVNAAVFDAEHGFRGCIPGIHEMLRRKGLLAGRWCLDPSEDLSPGQLEEIDRICHYYPHLSDNDFVQTHRDRWMEP